MNIALRVFLVLGAVVAFAVVVRKIKKSDMQARDSVIWLICIGALVLLAVFPQIAFVASQVLGFESPSNFILLAVIAILLIKVFSLSSDIAVLRQKQTTIVQEIALREKSDTD